MSVSQGTARRVAVLASGGVDSAVLVADRSSRGEVVQPIYIRFGLAWEATEEEHLRRFLDSLPADCQARPLVALEFPVADVYGSHWSVSGADVPDQDTADSAVYLPGRNLLLLAKSSVWCALNDFGVIALGTLKGNPFADSGAKFFDGLASLAELALDRPIAVTTPFAEFTKVEVLERGRHLALELTLQQVCRAAPGVRRVGTGGSDGLL
jgi:7-cyano-7-deazaguanine synthase